MSTMTATELIDSAFAEANGAVVSEQSAQSAGDTSPERIAKFASALRNVSGQLFKEARWDHPDFGGASTSNVVPTKHDRDNPGPVAGELMAREEKQNQGLANMAVSDVSVVPSGMQLADRKAFVGDISALKRALTSIGVPGGLDPSAKLRGKVWGTPPTKGGKDGTIDQHSQPEA